MIRKKLQAIKHRLLQIKRSWKRRERQIKKPCNMRAITKLNLLELTSLQMIQRCQTLQCTNQAKKDLAQKLLQMLVCMIVCKMITQKNRLLWYHHPIYYHSRNKSQKSQLRKNKQKKPRKKHLKKLQQSHRRQNRKMLLLNNKNKHQ